MSDRITDGVERLNGLDLHYEDRGEGEPLVLVHGFMGCAANWRLVFPDAPAGYRLLAPDLRGHGRSTNPDGTFTLRQAALDVLVLLDRLGIGRAKAIGLSGGGQILLHIATLQPDRLESMIVVGAAHYFPEEAKAVMRATTPESAPEETWRMMRSFHPRGDDQIMTLWRQANAFQYSDDPNFSPEQLATIRARTLIVHGDADPLYPLPVIQELHRLIPDSELWVIAGGGHGPVFGPHTAPFVARALEFLGRPNRGA